MNYEFYLDVFWGTNFLMDVLVLFLVRCLRKGHSALWRIFLSAAFGAAGSAFLFLSLHSFGLYQLLVHFVINPVMVFIAFPVKRLKSFWKDFFTTYLLLLLLGGILNWGVTALGNWDYFWLWAIGGFGICMLTLYWLEAGKIKQQEYEIILMTEQRKLHLIGFLDTGNLLVDPMMNQPVHIIQEDMLEEELAGEALAIRYIPFHSLGQEHGLLPVVTLKAMYIKGPGEKKGVMPIYLEKPVFGLAKEKLFQNKKYQVILNAGGISA